MDVHGVVTDTAGAVLSSAEIQDPFDARELLATIECRPAPFQTDDCNWSHERTTIGQRHNSRFSPSFERGLGTFRPVCVTMRQSDALPSIGGCVDHRFPPGVERIGTGGRRRRLAIGASSARALSLRRR
jgi:hypothetical protein